MKSLFIYFFVCFVGITLLQSCKKNDYFIGGTIRESKVDMTTYDFLKSHPTGLFDTLLLLIDAGNLKDKLNQSNVSFFAPTDYSISRYLSRRAVEEQNIDPFRRWTIDSVIKYELQKMVDSLDSYIVKEPLLHDNLTENGKIYPTAMPGVESVVSFERTFDRNLGYNPNVPDPPRIVYYTLLLEPISPPVVANRITSNQGIRTLVQTSGIQTTTGVIHVLNNSHILFFRK